MTSCSFVPNGRISPEHFFFLCALCLSTALSSLKVGLVGGAFADVVQTFHRVSKYEKEDKFISILNEDGRNAKERTLVFVETKRQADFLCLNLCEEVILHIIIDGRDAQCGHIRAFQRLVFMVTDFKAKESRY